MALLSLLVVGAAVLAGLFLWTVFTFIAVDQNDRLLWRVAPALAGLVAGVIVLLVRDPSVGLLVGALTTALLMVLGRVFLGPFDEVRTAYLREEGS